MLTGQNTEVHHDGLSFHVQTEDKGWANPYVESLVYLGGQVLDSRRTAYADLQDRPDAQQALAELMERQHQSMIDAVLAGDLAEQVAALRSAGPAASAGVEHQSIDLSQLDWESSNQGLTVTAVEETGAGTPAAATAVASALPAGVGGETLDEAVLGYLVERQKGETLSLGLSSDVDLHGGRDAELSLTAASKPAGVAVECDIEVKVVFSTQPPKSPDPIEDRRQRRGPHRRPDSVDRQGLRRADHHRSQQGRQRAAEVPPLKPSNRSSNGLKSASPARILSCRC